MSDFYRDYIVLVIDENDVLQIENTHGTDLIEVFEEGLQGDLIVVLEEGPQGVPGNPGVVLLQAGDPVPSPIVDGVLYLRLAT